MDPALLTEAEKRRAEAALLQQARLVTMNAEAMCPGCWVMKVAGGDDTVVLGEREGECEHGGSYDIACYGQIGKGAFGTIYRVAILAKHQPLPEHLSFVVAKCMPHVHDKPDDNNKEIRIATAAGLVVMHGITPLFPLVIGNTACVVGLNLESRLGRMRQSLTRERPHPSGVIATPANVLFSEMVPGDMSFWITTARSKVQWAWLIRHVLNAVMDMQTYLNAVHNDLHFGNILMTSMSDVGMPLLHDFGLALEVGPAYGAAGYVPNNERWASSESRHQNWRLIDLLRFLGLIPGTGMYPNGKPAPSDIVSKAKETKFALQRVRGEYYNTPTSNAEYDNIICAAIQRQAQLWLEYAQSLH